MLNRRMSSLHYRGNYFNSPKNGNYGKENLFPEYDKYRKDLSLHNQRQGNLYQSKFSAKSLSNLNYDDYGNPRQNLEERIIKRRSRSEGNEARNSRNFKKKETYSSSSHGLWSSQENKAKSREGGDMIWHLRTFNNWAKSYLMIKSLPEHRTNPIIGLDLGCSRGTDLKKWHHCNIDHLYLVENDFAAMKECRERFFSLQSTWQNFYNASFIQKDFTLDNIYISQTADIVSCQMALHKAFESRSKAERMARNVSNSLKCGGIFVASITCSSKILESLKSSPTGTSFGNPIYEVKTAKRLPKRIPDFGMKFEFKVGQNKFEEFLVQVPVLERIMAKYGLVLEERNTFLEMYFSARRNSDQVKCMHKMGVIRWGHERKDNYKVYLTMSESERQAASLYEALTFKKIFK